jgi:hypothetical protein
VLELDPVERVGQAERGNAAVERAALHLAYDTAGEPTYGTIG